MHKIYSDKIRTHKKFKVGDHVFWKEKSNKSSLKLGNYSKLAAIYCGPFEIQERIGLVAYMLALPASMIIHVFHVSFIKKYIPHANHVIDWNVIQVEQESAFQVHMVCILNPNIKKIWNRSIDLVKFRWTWYDPEYATWVKKDAM